MARRHGASMLLHQAVEQTPADSPSKPALSRALRLVHLAIDEGRAAILGVHTDSPAPSSLEQAFSNLLSEVTTGRPRDLPMLPRGSVEISRTQIFAVDHACRTRLVARAVGEPADGHLVPAGLKARSPRL